MTIPTPFFSVIIPTFNRVSLLSVAINSVINQTYSNWELLVIDDGSTDGTKDLIAKFTDTRLKYFFQSNKERSTARNFGIDHANGLYICFLDDDDYYLSNHLASLSEELIRREFPKAVVRSGYYRKRAEKLIPTSLYDPDIHKNPVKFAALNFTGVWSMCFHKSCLKRNKFPPQFRHWQDTHLILRILSKYPFYQLQTYSYVYVIHPIMGSTIIYDFENALNRIESNVEAIRHLFDNYSDLVSPFLPHNIRPFLVSKKYLDHAEGAMLSRRISLAIKLYIKSISQNKGTWLIRRSMLLPFKIVLKYLLGIPSR